MRESSPDAFRASGRSRNRREFERHRVRPAEFASPHVPPFSVDSFSRSLWGIHPIESVDPLVQRLEKIRDALKRWSARAAVKRLRILLVEDKWHVAGRMKAQLDRLGHEVVGLASDGQEAVGFAWRLEPDLIIMETQLPIIDGIETAQTILAHKPVPIILLTAYAAADFVRRAREVGVMAYLVTLGETRPLGLIIKTALARFEELEAIRREVGNLKDALKTRNLVEQAKRVLMRRRRLSEAEAFRNVQQQSRRIGTSLGESASEILRTEELLFGNVNVVRTLQSTLTAIHRGLRSTGRRPRRDAL